MKNIPKVNLFLNGILNRLEDPTLFLRIECSFYSGSKEFPLHCALEDGKLLTTYLGATARLTQKEFSELLTKELEKYDKIILKYIERTSTVVLTGDDRNVKTTVKETARENTEMKVASVGGRDYIIKAQEAPELLRAIGIMAENGKIKNDMIRKYNQIDRFIELVSDIPMPRERTGIILDCACGKSYLSFALNYYYTEIRKCGQRLLGWTITKVSFTPPGRWRMVWGITIWNFCVKTLSSSIAGRRLIC